MGGGGKMKSWCRECILLSKLTLEGIYFLFGYLFIPFCDFLPIFSPDLIYLILTCKERLNKRIFFIRLFIFRIFTVPSGSRGKTGRFGHKLTKE